MNPKRLPDDLSAWPKDPMAVLGVARGVDRTAARRAYTALLKDFNPEHFPDHFRRIREAYELVLRQVESGDAWTSTEPDVSFEAPPFESDSPAQNGPLEPPSGVPIAPADDTAADRVRRQAASIARWHDDLESLWNRAVARDQGAYRAMAEMEARFNGRRDLCLRLYWLLVAWPELDSQREPCDWLARGLRLGGLGGPLAELYRRELEDHPKEGLSDRCRDLLDSQAEPSRLADLAEARWRAAGRLDEFEQIADDLKRLRPRLYASAEEIWGRLILAAINQLCWSLSPEIQLLANVFWQELDELPHLHTELRYSLDQTETIRMVAVGWHLMRGVRDLDELLQLVRNSLLQSPDVVISPALACLHRLLADDLQMLVLFDRIYGVSPAMLAQVGQIIALCGGAELTHPPADEGHLRALARFEIESHYRNSYEELRPRLLKFCVREQVSPEALLRMPKFPMVWPESANTVLVRRIAADAALQFVYLAHRALGS